MKTQDTAHPAAGKGTAKSKNTRKKNTRLPVTNWLSPDACQLRGAARHAGQTPAP
ncbi:MAG: hypothetical protein JWP27_1280 [Flaviaesturariibacter sp.]|nr:hypothetical protein [Flaviaesturariibacter sp.]